MEIKVHIGEKGQVSIDGQILPSSHIWLDKSVEGHEEVVIRIPMVRVAIYTHD